MSSLADIRRCAPGAFGYRCAPWVSRPTSSELAFAHEIADRAGEIALRYFRNDPAVTWKPDATPVTEADLAVEAMIREELARRFPEDAIRGEEGGIEGSSDRMWIVDPIDGTRNYAAGIQIWANLLALKVGDEYVLGLVNAPALGERYAAVRGGGATWNGRPMHVSEVGSTTEGMIVFGDIELWAGTPLQGRFLDLVNGAQRNRGFGDFWGHMLVARGAAEVMVEPELWEWDLRAARRHRHRGRRARDAGRRLAAGARRKPGLVERSRPRRGAGDAHDSPALGTFRADALGPRTASTISPRSPAFAITTLAAATSWTPTPVRSHTVSWPADVRPGWVSAQISPSSTALRRSISPAASAWCSSPMRSDCSRLSTTSRSARAGTLESSSCLSGPSDPTAVTCAPNFSHSPRNSAVWLAVHVIDDVRGVHRLLDGCGDLVRTTVR